jgi:hypothetical protein
MSTPALVGSCGCGTVRFEVSEPLLGSIYCHCTRCQKRTGISIVRMAAIDGDPGVRPVARQFVAYHPAWAEIPDDRLPRFDEDLPRPSDR